MIAEQTTQSRYWRSPSLLEREIDLVARLETVDAGSDVDTELLYEPLAAGWDEAIADRVYEGVHAGLAAVAAPLPRGGLRVQISRLQLSPPLESNPAAESVALLGETVRAIVASAVESMWREVGRSEVVAADDGDAPRP